MDVLGPAESLRHELVGREAMKVIAESRDPLPARFPLPAIVHTETQHPAQRSPILEDTLFLRGQVLDESPTQAPPELARQGCFDPAGNREAPQGTDINALTRFLRVELAGGEARFGAEPGLLRNWP